MSTVGALVVGPSGTLTAEFMPPDGRGQGQGVNCTKLVAKRQLDIMSGEAF
jgi:hypothetical protein